MSPAATTIVSRVAVGGPISRIVEEYATWLGAQKSAEERGDRAHAHTCGQVANRLGWALAVLGVSAEVEP